MLFMSFSQDIYNYIQLVLFFKDMSTSTSISQNSKSSMDVGCKEYGIITIDSRSPQHQEQVFSILPINLYSPRKRKRLKK